MSGLALYVSLAFLRCGDHTHDGIRINVKEYKGFYQHISTECRYIFRYRISLPDELYSPVEFSRPWLYEW